MIVVAWVSVRKVNVMSDDTLDIVSSCWIVLVNSTDRALVSMVRVISVFSIVNRIFVASANHVGKGAVTVVCRALLVIPEGDGISSVLTIVHPKVIGTCTDILAMENTVVGYMVLIVTIRHVAVGKCLCISSIRCSVRISPRCLFRL